MQLISLIFWTKLSIYGSDFSEPAIGLCNVILNRLQNGQNPFHLDGIKFVLDDILDSKFEAEMFDLIVDKGTLDSIILASEIFVESKQVTTSSPANLRYIQQIQRILKSQKLLIILSCNQKEDELMSLFLPHNFELIANLSNLFTDDIVMIIFKKK